MDDQIEKEINRLKEEISRQKEEISDIKQLVRRDIDRDFPINLWELSERELDSEMGNRLSFLNDDIDTRPEPQAITSHRRILGKAIVFIKRLVLKILGFYTNTLLEKQKRFNEQLVAFNLASFIRSRHNEGRINAIEETLKNLEEDQALLLDRLDKIKNEKPE
jgi:chromosome segregation ATPase